MEVRRTISMKEVTCNDCEWCGVIIAPLDERERMKKYCPPPYFFDHPDAKNCPNFRLKKKEW